MALLLAAAGASAGTNTWTNTNLAEGVVWRWQIYTSLYGGKQTVHVFEVDLANPWVRVQPVRPTSGCSRTSSLGSGFGAIAAINGGFFDGSCTSLSMIKINNTVSATNPGFKPARSTFGYDRETKTPYIAAIAASDAWSVADDALGGGPNLVSSGSINVTLSAEGFDSSYASRAPRTALGFSGKKLLLVTVDGRTSAGVGMTLNDLAQYMINLGCANAMNLDGGGSTTAWASGRGVLNTPSDGIERSVTSALGIFAVSPATYVVDNTSTGFTASTNWWTSTSVPGFLGTNYHTRATAAVSDSARWSANLPVSGNYLVYARWTNGTNRATAAPYVISHTGGSTTVNVNQRLNNGNWVLLGTYNMAAGTSTRVSLSCWTTSGQFVVADAIRLVKQ